MLSKYKSLLIKISVISFLMSSVLVCVYTGITVIYAFKNPDLTLTRLILYFFNDSGGKIWVIVQIISYSILLILFGILDTSNDKDSDD